MEKILKFGEVGRFVIRPGEILKVTIISVVPQLADLWARRIDDPLITYHGGLTRDNTLSVKVSAKKRSLFAQTGTILYDSEENPIMEVIDDGGFKHDLTMPGCRRSVYERHKIEDRDGCRDLIADVMAIPIFKIGDTFNLFYEMEYWSDGYFKTKQVRSVLGAYCKFLSLVHLEVAITACPADLHGMNPGTGAIKVEITKEEG